MRVVERSFSRFLALLGVGLSLTACASPEAIKAMREEHQAKLQAAKIPEVQLSEEQIATLKALSPSGKIEWLRAGTQSDGKVFVCHVVSGRTLFGTRSVGLFTGTLEADGSYQRTPAYLKSPAAMIEDCRQRGFDPPITVSTTTTVIRM